MRDDEICTEGQDKLVKFVGIIFVVGLVAALLCGCDRGPSEEDMAQNCASHRTPTWADLIFCKAAKHDGGMK